MPRRRRTNQESVDAFARTLREECERGLFNKVEEVVVIRPIPSWEEHDPGGDLWEMLDATT